MSMTAQRRRGNIAEINVTPMADVMIVLLIIFMVTIPMIAAGPVRDLPEAEHATAKGSGPIVVSIAADASVSVEGVPLAPDQVAARLASAFGGLRARIVYVRAASGLPYRVVADVLRSCRRAGAEEIGFIALPRPRS